jgi:6,7-dimethyl-8-ribityllumazine synthase
MDLTLQGICLGNGILTCDTVDQAWARARVGAMNKGGGAAEAALRMIAIKRAMGRGEGKTPA